ncbi:hypothetical protein GCM10017044_02260 [Kordiimonas sediminis]|uniref:DUF2336 domain-containing protein n=1 Tax=Kordiimonas sediminis TaxID=1735581 RepID=A0A919AKK7_9PROT|nr:DUF2336 domain-containing protein [Kordiimonas sediminis]GHF11940.1 hypothetical protein GCM10017044_02260 [Kordiimonas sediminis]
MLSKLKGLFASDKKAPDTLTAEKEQQILSSGSDAEKKELASREDARPEVLYYLAEDQSASVRKIIAQNPSTPIQADEKLTADEDEEVRSELARKIARLIPNMPSDEQQLVRDKTIAILEKLAADQLPKVRAIIAEEIKRSDAVPKSIVDKLARDVEDIVCGPILAYSPLLNDDDLREIIAAGASSAVLSAIASREEVSEVVADDIAASLDIPAVASLLTNKNAQIREETLDQIISQAETVESLHRPLALRPQLSIRAMKRIAGFVASALVLAMTENSELNEEDADDILDRVRDRLASERVGADEEKMLAKQAGDLFAAGKLTDKYLLEMIESNNRELVIQCLSLLADVDAKTVRSVIHSKSGRAVTALVWKAGLVMRTAYEIQTKFALVPTAQLLPGKDGDKYPIGEDELEWHLSYFLEQED